MTETSQVKFRFLDSNHEALDQQNKFVTIWPPHQQKIEKLFWTGWSRGVFIFTEIRRNQRNQSKSDEISRNHSKSTPLGRLPKPRISSQKTKQQPKLLFCDRRFCFRSHFSLAYFWPQLGQFLALFFCRFGIFSPIRPRNPALENAVLYRSRY